MQRKQKGIIMRNGARCVLEAMFAVGVKEVDAEATRQCDCVAALAQCLAVCDALIGFSVPRCLWNLTRFGCLRSCVLWSLALFASRRFVPPWLFQACSRALLSSVAFTASVSTPTVLRMLQKLQNQERLFAADAIYIGACLYQ